MLQVHFSSCLHCSSHVLPTNLVQGLELGTRVFLGQFGDAVAQLDNCQYKSLAKFLFKKDMKEKKYI
jgi:hypothetical protein